MSFTKNKKLYNEKDAKIDKYLGTKNLRPGPPRKLINKDAGGERLVEEKLKINFSSYTLNLSKNINWTE